MADDKHRERIPADELTAYERWELPLVGDTGSGKRVPNVLGQKPVRPPTAADLEAIRTSAYQEGFRQGHEEGREKGYQQGYDKGLQEGRQTGQTQGREAGHKDAEAKRDGEISAALDRLQNLMSELLEPISKHDDEVEEALLHLTLSVSRAVIKRDLELDTQHIRELIREALDMLPPASRGIRIHIHPDDTAWVADTLEMLNTEAQIVENESILPGGCRVETTQSLIDYTVEKRFQKVIQQMLERRTTESDEAEGVDLAGAMGEMSGFHRDVLDTPMAVEEASDSDTILDSDAGVEALEETSERADAAVEARTVGDAGKETNQKKSSAADETAPNQLVDTGDQPESSSPAGDDDEPADPA